MRKLLFICAVVALASCGKLTSEESTSTMVDSTATNDSTFGAWADSVSCSTDTCDTVATCTTK